MKQCSFDGVIVDLGLPDSDGLDTFAQVSDAAGGAAIVVMTGRDDIRLAESAVRLGAQDYLVKSVPRPGEVGRAVAFAIRRQRILLELRRARDQQLEAKDRFLSHVSHELRSPLSVVHQFGSLMLDGAGGTVSNEQREFLTVLMRNVGHLKVMIDELLEVSRLQRGQLPVRSHALALRGPILEAVAAQRPSAATRDIELAVEADELPTVVADRDRVCEVLANLLENAMKFTPDGGRIAVQAVAEAGHVRVTVRDTGCGIRRADRERIFEQFFQAKQSDETSRNGLGLGLFVSRDLIQRQGGAIWAEAHPGHGAVVCFTLPLLTKANDPEVAS